MSDRPADAPAPSEGRRFNNDRVHVVSSRVQTFGMWVFLVTLAILFFSGMVGYAFIRIAGREMPEPGYLRPALESPLLFTSTALVLLASLAIHMAVLRVRREKRRAFLTWLILCDLLALAFVAVQTPAMIGLLDRDTGVGHALGQTGIRPTRALRAGLLLRARPRGARLGRHHLPRLRDAGGRSPASTTTSTPSASATRPFTGTSSTSCG